MNESIRDSTTRFGSDTTLRWSCREGDFLAWFRWKNIFGDAEHAVDMLDVWEMRSGDYVTITNRTADLPAWFELHPSEACNCLAYEIMAKLNKGYRPGEIVEGPNLWRARAGDRLAWVGAPRHGVKSHGNVLALLDFAESALVVGETNRSQTLEESLGFGSITPKGRGPEKVAMIHEATSMVRQMGVPRTIVMDWGLG